MFSSEKSNNEALSSSMISKDTIVERNITTDGNLRIEGQVIGDIVTNSLPNILE